MAKSPENGMTAAKWVHLPQCIWGGNTYTDFNVLIGGNVLGIGFLARHVVTFDFPKRIIYLKQTSTGPLLAKDG